MSRRDPKVNYAELERVRQQETVKHSRRTVRTFPCGFDAIAVEVWDRETKTGRVYTVEGSPFRKLRNKSKRAAGPTKAPRR